jgi:hypothetical protein
MLTHASYRNGGYLEEELDEVWNIPRYNIVYSGKIHKC